MLHPASKSLQQQSSKEQEINQVLEIIYQPWLRAGIGASRKSCSPTGRVGK